MFKFIITHGVMNKMAYAPLCRLVCKFDIPYLSIYYLIIEEVCCSPDTSRPYLHQWPSVRLHSIRLQPLHIRSLCETDQRDCLDSLSHDESVVQPYPAIVEVMRLTQENQLDHVRFFVQDKLIRIQAILFNLLNMSNVTSGCIKFEIYPLRPSAAASWICRALASSLQSRKPYSVNLLLGGYDTASHDPHHWIDYLGTMSRWQRYHLQLMDTVHTLLLVC
jgi:hypothetical protein